MSNTPDDRVRDLEARLAEAEGRLARLEGRVAKTEDKPEALKVEEVARLLQLSRMTVFRMLSPKNKRFDPVFAACSYKQGDARRFDPIRFEEYRQSRTKRAG